MTNIKLLQMMGKLKRNEPFNAKGTYTAAYLAEKASRLNMTIDRAAKAIYQIARAIEAQGNRGYDYEELAADLPTGMLSHIDCAPLWDGILFYKMPGRSGEYAGWGVRKSPYWAVVWIDRFGKDSPEAQELITAAYEQAAADDAEIEAYLESQRPQRQTERILGKAVEELDTRTVAHIAAAADVLRQRYQTMRLERDTLGGIVNWQRYIYQELRAECIAELRFRETHKPPATFTKKRHEQMVKDWAKARELFQAGTEYFYSPTWIEQAVKAAAEPELDVDYEHLPKLPTETTPVEWLSTAELLREFMRWCDATTDPASFEYEDKTAMLELIRTRLARAKGQMPKGNEDALAKLKAATLEIEEA